MEDAQKFGAGSESRPHQHGLVGAKGAVLYGAHGAKEQKKRVSIFDEQSHYVIENKGSVKRTKPNKADLTGELSH